jgi:uncharacterized protein (TIGR00251 family)
VSFPFISSGDGGVFLNVHVQPNAKRSRLAGEHDGCLKIAIGKPAVDGRANAELRRFLAGLFGTPQNTIQIRSGVASRRKRVYIDGVSAEKIAEAVSRGVAKIK